MCWVPGVASGARVSDLECAPHRPLERDSRGAGARPEPIATLQLPTRPGRCQWRISLVTSRPRQLGLLAHEWQQPVVLLVDQVGAVRHFVDQDEQVQRAGVSTIRPPSRLMALTTACRWQSRSLSVFNSSAIAWSLCPRRPRASASLSSTPRCAHASPRPAPRRRPTSRTHRSSVALSAPSNTWWTTTSRTLGSGSQPATCHKIQRPADQEDLGLGAFVERPR